ncbi:hypothetical protein ACERK3_06595 [Phycisphaerales bacterium AB-hyl4]|uniref:Uncharacterized protein n=1 Tax=Natronomicrosphaera hydrolytica TaxID=3242702 RepID=A0ABV4U2Z7_9BACT
MEDILTFARGVARDHQRVLAERDVDFIRFLVEVARRHRFSAALLRTRVQWYVTYNASKVGLVSAPIPSAIAAPTATSSAA